MEVFKLPISAMVVGRNEQHFLSNCLHSLSFCDEILYADLKSTDDSKLVASKYASKVFDFDLVPSGEYVHAELIKETKNDWIIYIDPDEVIDSQLASEIRELFPQLLKSQDIGAVNVPWKFYFKKKPLVGTMWGGENHKPILVNRARFEFLPITHYGRKLISGFISITIPHSNNNCLHHYWMSSYKVFIAKHKRYLVNEGKDHFNMGYRFSFGKMIATPFREFDSSFFKKQGFKDGFIGLKLSVFWAWYRTVIAWDIWRLGRKT